MLSWYDLEGRFRALEKPLRSARLDLQRGGGLGAIWRVAAFFDANQRDDFAATAALAGQRLKADAELTGSPDFADLIAEPDSEQLWYEALFRLGRGFEPGTAIVTNNGAEAIHHWRLDSPAGASAVLCLRLAERFPEPAPVSTTQQERWWTAVRRHPVVSATVALVTAVGFAAATLNSVREALGWVLQALGLG